MSREKLSDEFVKGAVWAITVLIQQHGFSREATNIFEELGIPFNELRLYGVSKYERDILRPHKNDLMRKFISPTPSPAG